MRLKLPRRTMPLLAGVSILVASAALGEPGAAPLACQLLPAEKWSSVLGYPATTEAGDGFCTYSSPDKSRGGQLRIIAVVGSSAEAEATVKRMREHQARSRHTAGLSEIESQGKVVFSVAVFQAAPTAQTGGQLKQLAAAVKQQLTK